MPSSLRYRVPLREIALQLVIFALVTTLLPVLGGVAAAQAPSCPHAEAPPPPVDTSEVPLPGAPVPAPVPVPATPVGGDRMAGCGLLTADGQPQPAAEVAGSAASWVLADLSTGEILAAKDPHARNRPASTIKILTALTAIRELRMDDTLVVTQEDANQDGTRIGLQPGVTYTVGQVLTGMLMMSGNDAAHALAMKLGGVDVALNKMNSLAASLGALDTRAATPSGLDGPGMSTSAYDLTVIFKAAFAEPVFATAIGTRKTVLPGAPGAPPLELWNDNQVLKTYPGGLGGKTGFTDDARHTFIGAADRNGRRLVAILMRGENQPVRLSQQAMHLLDYGFTLPPGTSVGQIVTTSPAPPPTPAPVARANAPAADPAATPALRGFAAPLGILVIAAAAVLVAVGVRVRRSRRAMSTSSDEHP